MQYHTAFMDCIEMHLIEQMLYISIQFCKKKYSASISIIATLHCSPILRTTATVRHQRAMLTGKDYTRVQLTCPALNHHSLNTTMLITPPAHVIQFSPNKSKGFEASDCSTSGWTASPGGARAYTHTRSHDQAGIQRLISQKAICIATQPCFCHTCEDADSVITC